MITPPIPDNEDERLKALRELLILDTSPEARFDRIAEFARTEFDTEMALVTFVDHDRQWFKAHIGLDLTETSRDVSFCAHALLEDDIMVVPDARQDQRFHDNPLVTGSPWIRFYAGALLRLPLGSALGTLCVIDSKPRDWTALDGSILRALRDLVMQELQPGDNGS